MIIFLFDYRDDQKAIMEERINERIFRKFLYQTLRLDKNKIAVEQYEKLKLSSLNDIIAYNKLQTKIFDNVSQTLCNERWARTTDDSERINTFESKMLPFLSNDLSVIIKDYEGEENEKMKGSEEWLS